MLQDLGDGGGFVYVILQSLLKAMLNFSINRINGDIVDRNAAEVVCCVGSYKVLD